jgi:hypothetical protein
MRALAEDDVEGDVIDSGVLAADSRGQVAQRRHAAHGQAALRAVPSTVIMRLRNSSVALATGMT